MITSYSDEKLKVAAFEQAKPGKKVSGDAHVVIQTEDYAVCAIVDGLGSGEGALQSSEAVVTVIKACKGLTVKQIAESCNKALLHKRGAVITIIKINYHNNEVSYCNHGNIGFVMYLPDGTIIRPIPARGYLSGKKQALNSTQFSYTGGSAFVMYSDGLKMQPDKKRMLRMESPKEEIYSLFEKESYAIDDVTILVGKLL